MLLHIVILVAYVLEYIVSICCKTGGYLNTIRTSLKFTCPAEHIPSKIEVDVSNLDIGDRIFMHDVEFHPAMELLSKNDAIPICKVMSTKSEIMEPAVV